MLALETNCDLVVVVDASMVGAPLMNSLTETKLEHGVLLLVGDLNQMLSVGPGRVLSDREFRIARSPCYSLSCSCRSVRNAWDGLATTMNRNPSSVRMDSRVSWSSERVPAAISRMRVWMRGSTKRSQT